MRCWGGAQMCQWGSSYLTKPSASLPILPSNLLGIAFLQAAALFLQSFKLKTRALIMTFCYWLARWCWWLGWSWLVVVACQWTVKQSYREGAELQCIDCRAATVRNTLATLIHLTWRSRASTNNSVIDRLITGTSSDTTIYSGTVHRPSNTTLQLFKMGFLVVTVENCVETGSKYRVATLGRRGRYICKDSNWPNEPLVPTPLPRYWAQILQGSTTLDS